MDRQAVGSFVVAVIGMAAVAVAAAMLGSTTRTPRGGTTGLGSADRGGTAFLEPQNATAGLFSHQFSIPPEAATIMGVIIALSVVGFAIANRREVALWIVIGAAIIGVLYVISRFVTLLDFDILGPAATGLLGGDDRGLVGTAQSAPSLPPVVLVLGIVLIGAIVALSRAEESDPEDEGSRDGTADPEPAAIGRAAGRGADRIEAGGTPENEVYRAWSEMTRLLDVDDPATTTSGEFAATAIDAGMRPGDVGELTGLFEDVRYGPVAVTDEYERRAVAVLRRIEGEYGE